MKIICSRREDVLKRKAEYEAKMAEYQAKSDEAQHQSNVARAAITDPIEAEISRNLKIFNALDFNVTVEEDYHWKRGRYNDSAIDEAPDYLTALRVRIQCNENQKRDQDALRWTYDARLDDEGNVLKETNSWSGLQATTPEQLTSLRQTLSALEYINSIDWAAMLEVRMPSYNQFYKDVPKRPDYVSFDSELRQADLEDAIGQDYWIKCDSWENSPYRGPVYVKVIGETPSQFKVRVLDSWNVDNYKRRNEFKDVNPSWYNTYNTYFDDEDVGYLVRVKKDNLHPKKDANGELIIFRPEDY